MDEKTHNGLASAYNLSCSLTRDLAAVASAQSAIREVLQPLQALAEVQAANRNMVANVIQGMNVHREITRSILDIANFANVHREIACSISAMASSVNLSFIKAFQDQMNEVFVIQKSFADLTGIADQIRSIANFRTGIDLSEFREFIATSLKEAEELDDEEQEHNARDSLFAKYDGEEYAVQREIVNAELAKVPGFAEMSSSAQFVQVLEIAVSYPSSDVQSFALGMAGYLLCAILGEPNAPGAVYKVFWLLFCFIVAMIAKLNSRLRVPKTRRLLRTIPIDKKHTRIVRRSCSVADGPRSKTPKLGRIHLGAVVTVLAQFRGWRQVYFVDGNGQNRAGWVRSKYLRKV